MSHLREPRLTPPTTKDPLGGYILQTIPTRHDYTIATYLWQPECGLAASKAIVFGMHGILGHSTFEWLSPDHLNHRTLLHNSLIHKLLSLDVTVVAHDHPGHGRSSGLHAYVDSHDHLRDVCIDVIRHFDTHQQLAGKSKYLMGNSMGGTTAIRVAMHQPQLLDGVILFSPAVRPPDDMFGPYGRFLKAISPLLGLLVPKLPVLKLPPSPDPVIRDAVEKDGLVHRGALRVQMGMEFLRVYHEINEHAHEIQFKKVLILIGKLDTIVSPSGIQSFVDRVQCEDKQVFMFEDLGHEVIREAGCEKAIDQCIQWLQQRV